MSGRAKPSSKVTLLRSLRFRCGAQPRRDGGSAQWPTVWSVRGQPTVGTPDRQRATLAKIVDAVGHRPWLDALLVVGSLADDAADALSDVDLVLVVLEGHFEAAWSERLGLHAADALRVWDQRPEQAEVGAHKWLTADLVLVEMLIATPSSGVRLAEPWLLVAGNHDVGARLTSRPPIERRELGVAVPHPVEAAYDEFKTRVRHAT